MIQKIIVKRKACGTLFMMKKDDFRLSSEMFSGGYEHVTEGVLTKMSDTDKDGRNYSLFSGLNGVVYRIYHDWSANPHDPEPPKTMEIQVCTTCGSGDVLIDAFVHANDPDDVRTFDDMYCENCEGSCKTKTVTVPVDFNVYSDIYKEGK